jgi:hypothetical protein
LGQIIHRQGPKELTVGDLDLYCAKWRGNHLTLRALEHKQSNQQLGRMQGSVLSVLDTMFQIAIANPTPTLRLTSDSGIFIVRGPIEAATSKRREVDFINRQTVSKVDGSCPFQHRTRKEFYDWLNGGSDWTPRRSAPRYG